jgi:1,4-alpha-glucan branching enzyme
MLRAALYRLIFVALAILSGFPPALRASTSLRVACFNVENGLYPTNTASYQDTATILKRINADVVGLCELMVTNGATRVGDNTNFTTLSSELGLPFAEFDTNNTPHRAGIASRYPIVETVWVDGTTNSRRIPLARIAVPGAENSLWVAMLHLKAQDSISRSEQHQRAAELYLLRQAIIANCDVQNDSIVIMGDFNLVSPDDWIFDGPGYTGVNYPLPAPKDANGYFVPEQIFKLDARHAGPVGETYTWRGDRRFEPGPLDHIMVNTPVHALGVASEVYDVAKDASGIDGLAKYGARPPPTADYGSDHLPVFADMQMADAPPAQFTISGAEGFFLVKDTAGFFDAVEEVYTITNDKTTTLHWFVHESASWLEISATTGAVAAGGTTNVTVSLNTQAYSLPPGDHYAQILFADQTTGSVVVRGISLRVMGAPIEIDIPAAPAATYADTFTYQGKMSSVLANGLSWSNRANGLTGIAPYSARWSAAIPLAEGTNVVDFRSAYATTNWSVLAQDTPSDPVYQSGWIEGSNGGQGFGPWRFTRARGWAGYALFGTNVWNIPPTFSGAFSLWAMGDGVTTGRRTFERALTTNDTFRLQFDNNWIEQGKSVGFALSDSNGIKRLDFYFVGGEFLYRVTDAAGSRVTDLPYTDQGLDLAVQLVGEDGYRLTAGTNVIAGALAPGGPVSSMVATNNGSGPGTGYDFYLGNMAVEDGSGLWAYDEPSDPAYRSGWFDSAQGGFGFGPWQMSAVGLAGDAGHWYYGAGVWNSPPAFEGALAVWASGNGISTAARTLPRAMEAGDAFVLQFDNNLVESGRTVGFALSDTSGAKRFEFYYVGGESSYRVNDATTGRDTTFPATADGFELRFEQTSDETYRLTSPAGSITGTLAPGGAIEDFIAINQGSGPGMEYDLYLGKMRVESISSTEHEVMATSAAVVREPAPSLEFTRGMSGRYTVGSSFYINANLGPNTAYAQFFINGAAVGAPVFPPNNGLNGSAVSWRYTFPSTGAYQFWATAHSPTGLVASTSGSIGTVALLEPLPVVSMLPFTANDTKPSAGSFVTLRAEAHFPSQEGTVEFYTDGIYLGTATKTAPGVYKFRWLTPVHPIATSITAQASVTYPGAEGNEPYFSAAISGNAVALTTTPPGDVSLAAGRTKFEAVVKNLTWPEAYEDAIAAGGRLAVFGNSANYDKVIAEVRRLYGDALWLGLTDQEEEGVWRWIDGTPLDFSRWSQGEPNDYNGNEDYAHVWWNWTAWNDNGGAMPGYLLENAPVELGAWPVSSGGSPWFSWAFDAADGKDAAVAMTSDDESTWREYTFTGPAEVQFQWKVSSQAGDAFFFSVNGTTIKSISGETDWTRETVALPSGTHTIRWTYAKDGAGSAGLDAGFLDCLESRGIAAPLGVQLTESGAQFGVWAPNATAVSVVGDFNGWSEAPLERDADTGYWTGAVVGATAGQEYQFLIRWPGNEAGRLKNDPRADWIRNGRSVVYDHSAFDWEAGFVPRTASTGLVYELHIGTFNNSSPRTKTVATFDDAIQRLDYLQELGVEIIALMPVTEYETTTSWGYNPAYLFAVENDYGGPDGLKRFVKAAHARGMKVQLDIVHNHYIQGDYRNKGNYAADGPGLLDFDGPEDIYFYGRNNPQSGDPDQPKRAAFNWGPRPDFSQLEVRRYIEDNVRHWLEHYRIDGFRWDSPKNILGYDSDGGTPEADNLLPEAKAMMGGINRMIREQYPGRWTIAEEPDLLVAGAPSGGGQFYRDAATTRPMEGFDGHWQYAFYDSIRTRLAWGSNTVSQMLNRLMQISEKPFTRVVFTDTHDLAGDLNSGLRVPHRVGEADPNSKLARKKTLLGAVLSMTAPGSPMLLMGQEFHATGSFSDRTPLDWSKAAANHRIFRAYRDLAALRGDFPSVRNTALSGSFGSNEELGIGRFWRGKDVVVAFNTSAQIVDNALFTFPSGGEWFVCINTDSTAYGTDFGDVGPQDSVVNVTSQDNRAPITIAPYSAIVFTRSPAAPTVEDADQDGLPDIWENITGAHDPAADEDGDGLDNLREFLSGLDPKVFNPDAVVATFNSWDPTATPLTAAAGGVNQRGHMQFFHQPVSGQFRWIFGGIFYGRDTQTGEPVADGPAFSYEAAGGTYIYFSAGENPATARAVIIDPANPLDSNGDGLDDRWQTYYGISNPDGDADADTLPNLREFLRGSNPLVPRAPAVVGDTAPLAWAPHAAHLRMTWSEEQQRWEWIGNLPAGPLQFKFATGPGWLGENHGFGDLPGTTDIIGGSERNIRATLPAAARYRFAFNEVTRTYSIAAFPLREGWRDTHRLPIGGPWTTDTDGDGSNDLLEYALGGDPRRADSSSLGPALAPQWQAAMTQSTSSGGLHWTWIENTDSDLVVMPETASDVREALWTPALPETAQDQIGLPQGHVRKLLRAPSGAGQFFMRLRVELP